MPIQAKTLQYIDYHEVAEQVNKTAGRDIRDWAGHFGNESVDHTKPYLDFWHKLLDRNDDIRNGSYTYVNFRDWAEHEEREWVKEIALLFDKAIPEELKDSEGGATFLFEW